MNKTPRSGVFKPTGDKTFDRTVSKAQKSPPRFGRFANFAVYASTDPAARADAPTIQCQGQLTTGPQILFSEIEPALATHKQVEPLSKVPELAEEPSSRPGCLRYSRTRQRHPRCRFLLADALLKLILTVTASGARGSTVRACWLLRPRRCSWSTYRHCPGESSTNPGCP